jgi:hypothetical protein
MSFGKALGKRKISQRGERLVLGFLVQGHYGVQLFGGASTALTSNLARLTCCPPNP